MKKHLLAAVSLMLATVSYSQMVYDFEYQDLVNSDEFCKRHDQPEFRIGKYAGEIFMKNGETHEGNFYIMNRLKGLGSLFYQGKIKIKCFPDGQELKLEPDEIEQINVYGKGNRGVHMFKYKPYVQDAAFKKKSVKNRANRTYNEVKFTTGKNKKMWMLEIVTGKINLYLAGTAYYFSDGEMTCYSYDSGTQSLLYIGQMEERDKTFILLYFKGGKGNEKYFLGIAPAFFEGHPMSKKIRTKMDGYDFAYGENLERLIEMYNQDSDF